MLTQPFLSSIHYLLSQIKEYRCLKKVSYQIDSKNEWSLDSDRFTAKFELVFCVHTGKRVFLGSSEKRYLEFSK